MAFQTQESQEDSQEEQRKVEAHGAGGWSGFRCPLMGWVVGSHLKGRQLQGQEPSAYGTDSWDLQAAGGGADLGRGSFLECKKRV